MPDPSGNRVKDRDTLCTGHQMAHTHAHTIHPHIHTQGQFRVSKQMLGFWDGIKAVGKKKAAQALGKDVNFTERVEPRNVYNTRFDQRQKRQI